MDKYYFLWLKDWTFLGAFTSEAKRNQYLEHIMKVKKLLDKREFRVTEHLI